MTPALRTLFCLYLTAFTAAAETRVVVTGAQRSGMEIMTLLGDRLSHVRASPPSAPLADDAAFMLRQLLVKDGHAGAVVTWKISGPEEITLIVDEGRRSHIGEVSIHGVPKADVKKLAAIYAKPAQVGKGIGIAKAPFRQSDVATGVSYVQQELFARGYWLAEVVLASQKQESSTGAVDLQLNVNPGPLFQISPPETVCEISQAAALVSSTAAPFIGQTATTANLNSMRMAVETAAKAQGYPNVEIRMERSLDGSRFIPKFFITPGKRVKLHEILIAGLGKTKPHRIERRLKPLQGDWYDEAALHKRLGELLATGAFSSVRVETSESGPDAVDATISFEEAEAREFTAGLGFGSYQGAIIRGGYSDRNLFGHLLGFSAGLEVGSRGLLGEVRLTEPWLFGTDISTTLRYYALIYGREGYDTYETGIEDKFTWKYGKHYTLELLGGYSIVNASADGLPDFALGLDTYTHPRVRISQSFDFRDNPVLPKSGWHIDNYFQAGAALGDDSFTYLMAGVSGGWHHQLGNNYEIGVGGDFGFVVPSCDLLELPIDLRLFNGGSRTVRSFPERELGPTIDGYAFGGESAWSVNFEFIRKISDSLKVVSFIDAGSIAGGELGITEADVELAAGLGIRLDLPIGPVRLEYGYNLTRDQDEPAGALHFAIGAAF